MKSFSGWKKCGRSLLLGVLFLIFAVPGAAFSSELALTSVGQSPDGMMVRVILKKLKLEANYGPMMKASDLSGEKVLIFVVGGSSKGLGAAGIDKADEKDRATALMEKAQSLGMKVLVMHVGGEGRRGQLSDYFIESAIPFGDKLIVVKGGNEDGIFDKLKKPEAVLLISDSIKSSQEELAAVLKEWGIAIP